MLSQKEWTRLKGRLTRAENKARKVGDLDAWQGLAREATYGLAQFEELGYPDYWHHWQRAQDDATYQVARLRRSW